MRQSAAGPPPGPPPTRGIVIRCAGGIVHDAAGRLLLVRRGREPGQGLWSVPGGRVEPAESVVDAVAREVREETGLLVAVGSLAGVVYRPGADPGTTYEIHDHVCTVTGGRLAAGDDADEVRWVTSDEAGRLALVPGLIAELTGWGLLAGR